MRFSDGLFSCSPLELQAHRSGQTKRLHVTLMGDKGCSAAAWNRSCGKAMRARTFGSAWPALPIGCMPRAPAADDALANILPATERTCMQHNRSEWSFTLPLHLSALPFTACKGCTPLHRQRRAVPPLRHLLNPAQRIGPCWWWMQRRSWPCRGAHPPCESQLRAPECPRVRQLMSTQAHFLWRA